MHRQFAHPTPDKLVKLLNSAGQPWNEDQQLKDLINDISKECNVCQIYRRPPPRPVVGLPLATTFQECVAMDLKFYENHIILHLIDHATRLSASIEIENKLPKTVIRGIFTSWIQVFGTPEKFLTDNGGEFANQQFLDLCESMNIQVHTTAAEAQFSNGLVERHNLVISEMLDKILEENNIDFKLALAWCLNAKNSLSNVHGFSPYQLAMGQNPKLPSTLSDKLPALSTESTNKLLSDNLKALHDAREAYIASESSKKIRRALSHNIRTSGDRKYITGNSIFFKRQCDRKWRGPAKVLGQDGQQVLIKYGSTYVRVHPCRITPARENFTSPESTTNKTSNKTNNALSNYEEHTQQNFTAPPISTCNVETFPSQNDTKLLPTTDTELPTSDNCNESLPLTVSSSKSIPKETNNINLPSTSSNTTTSSNNIAETSKASVNQLDDFSSSFENLSISDDKSELKLKKDIYKDNILIGILLCHVDDMIFGGKVEFHKNVIEKLKFIFKFGSEESNAFKYVGIEISQNDDYRINIQKLNYIQSIEEIPIRKQPKDDVLTDKEKTLCRRIVGQLNWIAGISRPDVSFYICEASTKLNNSTISDAVKINKIVRYVK